MKTQRHWMALATSLVVAACGASGPGEAEHTGGTTSAGGRAETGARGGSGGAGGSGGSIGSGGATAGTTSNGGTMSSGGATSTGSRSTGGSSTTGGNTSGGQTTTGGVQGTGGRTGAGGTTSAGGTTTTGGTATTGGRSGTGGVGITGGTTGTGGAIGTGGGSGSGGATTPVGPCDIYAAASPATPCAGAYSMARVLSSAYAGPLYQVRKGGTWDKVNGPSGGTFKDIGTIAGGHADVDTHDSFCAGGTCTVSILYDQSGKQNDLEAAPPGCYKGGDGAAAEYDKESLANRRPTTLDGHKVYALQTLAHEGYRNNKTTGMVTGNQAQGVYMVADGRKAGTACCWDFGNAMPTNCADGTGSMDALMLGTGFFGKGAGNGPWFMGDFEFGVWACGSQSDSTKCSNPNLPAMNTTEFGFGILKTSTSGTTGQYCLRTANAQSGAVTTAYDGQAPQPWHLGGAIILGIGGDNSNWSFGTFFEGVITAGRPSDATDALVLANIQAAKYGQ